MYAKRESVSPSFEEGDLEFGHLENGVSLEMFEKAFFPPPLRRGLRPTNKMSRYLKEGAAGEVR